MPPVNWDKIKRCPCGVYLLYQDMILKGVSYCWLCYERLTGKKPRKLEEFI